MSTKQAFRTAIAMRMFHPLVTNEEIAQCVERDVTTVQRWIRELRSIAEENGRNFQPTGESAAP